MSRFSNRARCLWVGCAVVLGGCFDFDAAVETFCRDNPAHPSCTSAATDAGADGGTDAGADAGTDGGTDAGVVAGPECDPDEVASDSEGYFVHAQLGDDTFPGRRGAPFKSLARGLQATEGSDRVKIFLGQTPFAEAVAFGPQHAGLVLSGGWKDGLSWTRDCSEGARELTTIHAPGTVGVEVATSGAPTPIRLERLTIQTATAPAATSGRPGDSTFALKVRSGRVVLFDVSLRAGRAAAGGAVAQPAPAGALACVGVQDCSDGATGSPGSPGDPAPSGRFEGEGYLAGSGAAGTVGKPGHHGTTPPPRAQYNSCLECTGVSGCSETFCGSTVSSTSLMADRGRCGCGGAAGAEGAGGPGGGASVALWVGPEAAAILHWVSLQTAGGGAGSPGAPGGDGGPSKPGTESATVSCADYAKGAVCGYGPSPACHCGYASGPMKRISSPAGGDGGAGGHGGAGGGGAGGDSVGLVALPGAMVEDAEVTFDVGPGGVGGDAAAPVGRQLARLTAP